MSRRYDDYREEIDSPSGEDSSSDESYEDEYEDEYPSKDRRVTSYRDGATGQPSRQSQWTLNTGMHTQNINFHDVSKPRYVPPRINSKCACCNRPINDGHEEKRPEKCFLHHECLSETGWIRHFQKYAHFACPLRNCEKRGANFGTPERFMQHWKNKHPDKCWFWQTESNWYNKEVVNRVQFKGSMDLHSVVAGH